MDSRPNKYHRKQNTDVPNTDSFGEILKLASQFDQAKRQLVEQHKAKMGSKGIT